MDVDEHTEQRLRDELNSGLGGAPPIERITQLGRRRQLRNRSFGAVGVVLLVALGAGSVRAMTPGSPNTVIAGPTDGGGSDTPGDEPAPRSPTAIKDDVLDALDATAPGMLTVTTREDDITDRAAEGSRVSSSIQWDFADPSRYELDEAPAGVEWMNPDPGGGVRASSVVTVTPGFRFDLVTQFPEGQTVTACGTCDFTTYVERPYDVQWFVMKDDVQISVVSERPEVWPEMRAWLERFAARIDDISLRSDPGTGDSHSSDTSTQRSMPDDRREADTADDPGPAEVTEGLDVERVLTEGHSESQPYEVVVRTSSADQNQVSRYCIGTSGGGSAGCDVAPDPSEFKAVLWDGSPSYVAFQVPPGIATVQVEWEDGTIVQAAVVRPLADDALGFAATPMPRVGMHFSFVGLSAEGAPITNTRSRPDRPDVSTGADS